MGKANQPWRVCQIMNSWTIGFLDFPPLEPSISPKSKSLKVQVNEKSKKNEKEKTEQQNHNLLSRGKG